MDDSIWFIAVFFLPFVAYICYSRIRLDEDHTTRRQGRDHHGRHFCGIDASGHSILTDPFVEDVPAPEVAEISVAEVQSLRCWEPIQ